MKPQSLLKQVLKKRGYDVKIRTVSVKHPFIQVWLPYMDNMPYEQQPKFDNNLRKIVLQLYYNLSNESEFSKLNILNIDDIDYGNIKKSQFSLDSNKINDLITALTVKHS